MLILAEKTIYGILLPSQNGSRFPNGLAEYSFLARSSFAPDYVIAFTLHGIRYGSKTTWGYMYHKPRGVWKKGLFPLPTVVINRSYLPTIVGTKLWRLTRGKIFNVQLWLSKARIHALLSRNKQLWAHLPPTYSLRQRSLASLLTEHHSLYLKPTLRAQGRGIIHVRRTGPHTVSYNFMENSQTHSFTTTLAQVGSALGAMLSSEHYIAQRDVQLASLGNRKFDLRVMIARTPENEWQVTGSYARIANKTATVTNASQGGAVTTTGRALSSRFGKQHSERIYEKLVGLSQEISQTIGSYYKGMVLLGLDFGIDNRGRIWFIEANAFPGTVAIIRNSRLATALWNFAYFLDGKHTSNEREAPEAL